ncbi:tricarballylate utilization 4Fe-4S protein TcuB [Marichromatium gracile]|uniref:tricarballylate utilization 4Fe-4S protein TcuB n=1 Tax=Marichromatium gracile TaxID=1048 RepID=UPI001F1757D0|nr:tricarballylate utilization 4Fe-4S protein TcuB [Marichromatium gracile]MCF1184961.1 tricarballylate utilization 4Fe-4S protein TcuB [Marichromatium gracile]
MSSADPRAEARRVLAICNACGYCNGFCDVFESARLRPALTDTDLEHLAHLCHHCRNCLYACQYAPPHPFAVNVPRALTELRHHAYVRHAWPRPLARLLVDGPASALLVALATIALVLGAVLALVPHTVLFAVHQGPGAFYAVIPWGWMSLLAALPLGWSLLAVAVSLRRVWREGASAGEPPPAWRDWRAALADLATLRNLRGGGPGCNDLDDRPSHWRRRLHHTLLLGLLGCLAATTVATVYHHLLGLQAPYPWWSLPVVLGTLGGLAMTIATLGLAWLTLRADPTPSTSVSRGADAALLALLAAVALSGLALLGWRATAAMGVLLALHLGTVSAFFLLIPYSKLVHGGYRALALLREAAAKRRRARRAAGDASTAG